MKIKVTQRGGRLTDIRPGLFLHENTLGFKSEYYTENGAVEAYCVDSGEFFWGGTKTGIDQCNLFVHKVKIKPDYTTTK